MKFWLTLILGTIAISAGVTFLNLYKGAQTIDYPPPAKLTEQAAIEFLEVKQPLQGAVSVVRANAVTIELPETKVGSKLEGLIRFKSTGKVPLLLTYEEASANLEVHVNERRLTGTDARFELPPGQEATMKLSWVPARDQVTQSEQPKTRVVVRFEHNDDRFTDDLIFEFKALIVR